MYPFYKEAEVPAHFSALFVVSQSVDPLSLKCFMLKARESHTYLQIQLWFLGMILTKTFVIFVIVKRYLQVLKITFSGAYICIICSRLLSV